MEQEVRPVGRYHPLYWLRRLFPDLDTYSVVVVVTGCVAMVLFLYHGRPHQLEQYFPDYYAGLEPAHRALAPYVYSHLAALVTLCLFPIVVSLVLLRTGPHQMGVAFRRCGRELIIVMVLLALLLPVLIWISGTPDFQEKYPKLKEIKSDAALFWAYQGFYLIKWFAWEYFFRGFLLFGLHKRFGESAILFSTMPFVVIHLGKPEAEIMGAIVAGIVLGRLALAGRSILPTVWLHFAVAGVMDFLTSDWWR